jgi:hypothetical protein
VGSGAGSNGVKCLLVSHPNCNRRSVIPGSAADLALKYAYAPATGVTGSDLGSSFSRISRPAPGKLLAYYLVSVRTGILGTWLRGGGTADHKRVVASAVVIHHDHPYHSSP